MNFIIPLQGRNRCGEPGAGSTKKFGWHLNNVGYQNSPPPKLAWSTKSQHAIFQGAHPKHLWTSFVTFKNIFLVTLLSLWSQKQGNPSHGNYKFTKFSLGYLMMCCLKFELLPLGFSFLNRRPSCTNLLKLKRSKVWPFIILFYPWLLI